MIRRIYMSELREYYGHIVRDFAPGEYAPYGILRHQLMSGALEGWILSDGGRDMGYSITTNAEGFILIGLFAVEPEYRGLGLGTKFMREITGMFEGAEAVIVEVERPELADSPEDARNRQRRVLFYEKLGFRLIDGIDYTIWDIPMLLMALPLRSRMDSIVDGIEAIMRTIYLPLLGERHIHRLSFGDDRPHGGGQRENNNMA